MTNKSDIDILLEAQPSDTIARQLVVWAGYTRDRIARGDLMLGLLSIDEVTKIPTAYQTAAEHGDSNAWIMLAWWYALPDVGKSDPQRAEAALQKALDANVENAQLELVKIRWFFKRDTATKSEQKQAYQLVSGIVKSDPANAEAIYFLALLTTHGFGVDASPETGFQLQLKSADLGCAHAMFELFVHYSIGLGVAADEQAAYKACQRAAEAGHSRAMYNLGAFNASGRGMPKNISEAIKWYERAADLGNPSAMAMLAVIYATGDGVEPDREYAAQLFDQADYEGFDVSKLRQQVGL
jgi:TPR repeat protein